jgi:toxin YhaV
MNDIEPPLAPLTVNGWSIFPHPAFIEQFSDLLQQVQTLKKRHPDSYTQKNATKRLAAIWKLLTKVIPADPTADQFRLGNTLGAQYRHWFRAKFFQQYRLFFRYHEASKVIVIGWVNDSDTLRAYDSKDDAYAVFYRMLGAGNPPDSWDKLLKEAHEATAEATQLHSQLDELLK